MKMPNRIIREGIVTSERVNALGEWGSEVFYRRVMSVVDDYGRCEANPKLLLGECFALKLDTVSVADIERWLDDCTRVGLLVVYAAAGKRYLEITNFHQRQRYASRYPSPGKDRPQSDHGQTEDRPRSVHGQPMDGLQSVHGQSTDSPLLDVKGVNLKPKTLGINGGVGSAPRVRARTAPNAAAAKTMNSVEISTALIGWERERHKAPRCSSGNVQIVAIAELGVTPAELRSAYEAAVADRDATDDPGPVNAGFLRAFVVKGRMPRRKGTDAEWARSDEGIKRKAHELGLSARGGETYLSLKARCFDELHRQSANGQGASR